MCDIRVGILTMTAHFISKECDRYEMLGSLSYSLRCVDNRLRTHLGLIGSVLNVGRSLCTKGKDSLHCHLFYCIISFLFELIFSLHQDNKIAYFWCG